MAIILSSTNIDFGTLSKNESIIKTVTIFNTGATSINVTSISSSSVDFEVAPTVLSIDAYGSKNISIEYTADSTISATITVYSSVGNFPISVFATVLEPTVSLDTSVIVFADTAINDSITVTRQISNTATNGSILNVQLSSTGSDVVVSPLTLSIASGGFADISITFNPVTVGILGEIINITTNDSVGSYLISTVGECLIPILSYSPAFLQFNSVAINNNSSLTLTITNISTVNLIISSITIVDSSITVDSSSATIAPTDSHDFVVTWSPMTPAEINNTLIVNFNGGTLNILYIGTALVVPILTLTPNVIDFEEYIINTDKTVSLQINNKGTVDLVVNSITFPTIANTTFSAITVPFTILNNSSVALNVTVQSSAEITFSDTLVINSTSFNSPQSFSITGDAQSPEINIDINILDFGTLQVGETKQLTFTVTNTKDVVLIVTINTVPHFTLSEYSFTVLPQDSNIVTVDFILDTQGDVSETLSISSNDINNPVETISLIGSANLEHSFSVIPTIVVNDFLSVSSEFMTNVTVINKSVNSAIIDSMSFVTAQSSTAVYTIATTSLPMVLLPGEAKDVSITILATTIGIVEGYLKFNARVGSSLQNNTSITVNYNCNVFSPTISLSTSSINFGLLLPIGIANYQNVIISNNSADANLKVSLSSPNDAFFIKSPLISELLTVSKVNSKYIVNLTNSAILDSISVMDDLTNQVLSLGDPAVANEYSVNTDTGIITVNSSMNARAIKITYNYKLPTTNITVNKNSNSTVIIGFIPKFIGADSANITVLSNDIANPTLLINVSGTGIANITSISMVHVLTTFIAKIGKSITQKAVLKNTGTVKLFVTSIDALNPFTVDNSEFNIDPNETYDLTIRFTANNDLLVFQNIILHSNAPDFTIAVTAQGASPQIALPASINFGNSAINIEKNQTLTINNTGIVDLDINLQTSTTDFSISPTTFSILPQTSYDVIVIFKPTVEQSYSASLKVESDDVAHLETFIPITGIGVVKPIIDVVSELDFLNVNVGQITQLVLTVRNIGSANLMITSIGFTEGTVAFSVSHLTPFIPTTIIPSSSISYTIIFTPRNDNDYSENIRINCNDIDNPQINVTIKGIGVLPEGSWKPFDLQSMLPSAVITAANAVDSVIDPLKISLNLIKNVMNIVKILLVDTSSALKIILDMLAKAISDYVTDLKATGIYLLPVLPNSNFNDPLIEADKGFARFLASMGGGSEQFKRKINDSFDDIFDSKRPQFSTTANVGAYVIAVDSANAVDVIKGIIALKNIFTAIDWEPDIQVPESVQALSADKAINLVWEIPSFVNFSIAGTYQKQDLISALNNVLDPDASMISAFEVYRTESQSIAVIATQDSYDAENTTVQKSKKGDVINSITKEKLTPVKTVPSWPYSYRDNFAVGWDVNSHISSKALLYEYNDTDVVIGKNYYYTVRSIMKTSGSLLSNEVTGVAITQNITKNTTNLLKCAHLTCTINNTAITIIKTLNAPVVKLIDRTGIVQKAENGSNIQTNAGYQQVYNFTFPINNPDIDLSNLIIKNISAAIRNLQSNLQTAAAGDTIEKAYASSNKSVDTFFKNIKDLPEYAVFMTALNNTQVNLAWELIVSRDQTNTIITITDISNIGYLTDDDVLIQYNLKTYTIDCSAGQGKLPVFNVAKCTDGSNKGKCPFYLNNNCVYNNGISCSNNGRTRQSDNKCISNRTFYNVVRCQNGSMRGFVNILDKQYKNDANYCIKSQGICAGYTSMQDEVIGVYPNWMNFSAQALVQLLEKFVIPVDAWVKRETAAIQKGSDTVKQFIDLLTVKIEALEEFIDELQKIIDTLNSVFSTNAGFYVLNIPVDVGGIDRIKSIVQSAQNGPSSGSTGYTAGVAIVIGGPNVAPVQKFLQLFLN